jgi:hypothetical protein
MHVIFWKKKCNFKNVDFSIPFLNHQIAYTILEMSEHLFVLHTSS